MSEIRPEKDLPYDSTIMALFQSCVRGSNELIVIQCGFTLHSTHRANPPPSQTMSDPISFDPNERSVIQDTRFFHTKAIVTRKVKQMLHQLHKVFQEELAPSGLLMTEGVDTESGQFVKGEHLLDYPYQYLDFPKLFTQEEKFAFRTLFWWGHFMVFSWILEGRHLEHYKTNLIEGYDRLADQGLFLLMTETPWEWRKAPDLLLEMRKGNRNEVIAAIKNRSFLKIHRYLDFDSPGFVNGTIVQEGREIFRLMRMIVAKKGNKGAES